MNEAAKTKAWELDQTDSLASFKEQFHFPKLHGKSCIYFCGNSLGLQPKNTQAFIDRELKNWREKGVKGHFMGDKPWVSYHHNSKESLAKIVGAKPHEVIAMNTLTSNLHLAMKSFYRPKGKRSKILIEHGAFPSDFYVVHSQIVTNGYNPKENLIELKPEGESNYLTVNEIINTIEKLGEELAIVIFPGVQYYTGQFFDIQKISEAAHKIGAYAGFDLAHAVGNVPLNLHDDGVDFSVWCTYKYLNSGPGCVGGLFVHEQHGKNKELPRLSGWWGHNVETRFEMNNLSNPIPSVDGWQLSNPNILSHASHLASLQIFDEAGIQNLRKKSLRLTEMMEEMILESELLQKNIKIITPANPGERGCQLSLYFPYHGKRIYERLMSRGVIVDWRDLNVIRVAPVPLYNSFSEVVDFISILEDIVENG